MALVNKSMCYAKHKDPRGRVRDKGRRMAGAGSLTTHMGWIPTHKRQGRKMTRLCPVWGV